jgi:hypothetical protein
MELRALLCYHVHLRLTDAPNTPGGTGFGLTVRTHTVHGAAHGCTPLLVAFVTEVEQVSMGVYVCVHVHALTSSCAVHDRK